MSHNPTQRLSDKPDYSDAPFRQGKQFVEHDRKEGRSRDTLPLTGIGPKRAFPEVKGSYEVFDTGGKDFEFDELLTPAYRAVRLKTTGTIAFEVAKGESGSVALDANETIEADISRLLSDGTTVSIDQITLMR